VGEAALRPSLSYLFDTLVATQNIVDLSPAGRVSFTQKSLHIGAGLFALGMKAEG